MQKRTLGRIVGLLLVTAGLAGSIVTMYVGLARFEPVWFWSSVAAYVFLLFLVLFVFRIRADEGEAPERVRAPARGGLAGGLAAGSLPEAPIEVERATGATRVAREADTARGFSFRGFTLYERDADGKRFFAKRPPAGAEAIALPTGYEASWDARKKEPKLVRLIDEAPEVVVDRGAGRPCSAWNAPGEICENVSARGSPYCTKHAKYKSGDEWGGGVEARIARGSKKGGRLRWTAPTVEVVTAKPRANPLRVGVPTVEVRMDARKGKPLGRLARLPGPEVRVAKPPPGKPLRVKPPEPEVRVSREKAPKPLRLGTPDIEVRVGRGKPAKPLRLAEPKVEVRVAKPKAMKRLDFGSLANVEVRSFRSRTPGKIGAGLAASEVEVVKPKGALIRSSSKPSRCVARLEDGSRCSRNARAGAGTCARHANWKPSGEVLVVRDTKSRSGFGLPDAAVGRGR